MKVWSGGEKVYFPAFDLIWKVFLLQNITNKDICCCSPPGIKEKSVAIGNAFLIAFSVVFLDLCAVDREGTKGGILEMYG